MLYKSPDFWEKERNSPFFSRSGFRSEKDLLMILPKFRNLLRLVRTDTNTSTASSSDGISSTGKEGEEEVVKDLDKLSISQNSGTNTNLKGATTGLSGTTSSPEMERIFLLDAERTFLCPTHRNLLFNNLKLVYTHLLDYHQGEGFLIALLSIYLTPAEVVEVVTYLSTNILQGYFSSTPFNYVRDCKVIFLLLKERDGQLFEKLDSLIVPEAFLSKWLIGLNVHLFTFEWVINFLNYLVVEGHTYLFKFALAFLAQFRTELMDEKDLGKILSILRLEHATSTTTGSSAPTNSSSSNATSSSSEEDWNKVYQSIVVGALDVKVDAEQVDELRRTVKEKMEKEEEDRRLRMLEYEDGDEIVFSDEE